MGWVRERKCTVAGHAQGEALRETITTEKPVELIDSLSARVLLYRSEEIPIFVVQVCSHHGGYGWAELMLLSMSIGRDKLANS